MSASIAQIVQLKTLKLGYLEFLQLLLQDEIEHHVRNYFKRREMAYAD